MNHDIYDMQGYLGKKEGELFNAKDMSAYCLYITFNSEESAEKFTRHFPKYCKAKKLTITYYDATSRECKKRPACKLTIANHCDERTGEFNETAQKRQDKTTEILKNLGLYEE